MPRRVTASEQGLKPHYKVRVVIPGTILHLASWSEPEYDAEREQWDADWIEDPEYGDTIGFINWDVVAAFTWRYTELSRSDEAEAVAAARAADALSG